MTTKDLLKHPEADILVDYIVHRKKQGLYSLIFTSGLPGSGKTSTDCRMMELVSMKILGKNNVKREDIVDSFVDFCVAVDNANPEELNQITIEELNVLFPSRRAMSGENVDMNKILDICRKKQIIIYANAPLWPSIDSHMRALGNVYVECLKVYKEAKIVVSKFQRLQTSPFTGKTYHKNFHRDNKTVRKMYTRQSNKKEWDKYEAMKDAFIKNVITRAKAKSEDKRRREDKLIQKMTPTNINILTPQEVIIHNEVTLKGRGQKEVGDEMELTQSRVSQIISKINEKKGNL